MPNTIQTSINAMQAAINFWVPSVGTNFEPAITAANMTQQVMIGPPFKWSWNRNSFTFTTTAGVQDYTQSVLFFGFLETLTIRNAAGKIFSLNVKNNTPLGESADLQQPVTVSVQGNIVGTSITLRFLGVPDQVYTVVGWYQKFLPLMTGLSDPWGAPDYLSYVYNRGFLAHLYEARGDVRAQQEKVNFAAALLGNAEGLTETEQNIFMAQYLPNLRMSELTQLKTQQGVVARGT